MAHNGRMVVFFKIVPVKDKRKVLRLLPSCDLLLSHQKRSIKMACFSLLFLEAIVRI